jgi:hypothetical protein
MPANIAHMLIAHKAADKLRAKGIADYSAFADMLEAESGGENCRPYFNLGSMGPDLFYYRSLVTAGGDFLTDDFVQARGPEPWAYQMHSLRPNQLPLVLAEIIFQDASRSSAGVTLDANARRKLAFVAGYLTHIAADQIIHPLVNGVAGPYYADGAFRKTHRECEVLQDYFLYMEVYRLEGKAGAAYDFFDQSFHHWADCIRGLTTGNTEEWFRYFLQRGFAQTYAHFPTEDEIESSVDNLLLILRGCKIVGPYRRAADEYKHRNTSDLFRKYVTDPGYILAYYTAVELAVVYLAALYEIYCRLLAGKDVSETHHKRFMSIVQSADLSCPLEGELLPKATASFESSAFDDAFQMSMRGASVTRLAPHILDAGAIQTASQNMKALVAS